jgi:hypothetical protein
MPNNNKMSKSRPEIDRLFEKGISDVAHEPRKSLSEAEIAAAAAASKSGAGIWLLSHAKEILLCALSFAAGIGGTLLVTHAIDNRNTVPAPDETVVSATTDTIQSTNTVMIAEDTVALSKESTATDLETLRATSLQNGHPVSHVSRHTSHVSNAEPVTVKKTIVQRDTVVINETVILKDTVYVP